MTRQDNLARNAAIAGAFLTAAISTPARAQINLTPGARAPDAFSPGNSTVPAQAPVTPAPSAPPPDAPPSYYSPAQACFEAFRAAAPVARAEYTKMSVQSFGGFFTFSRIDGVKQSLRAEIKNLDADIVNSYTNMISAQGYRHPTQCDYNPRGALNWLSRTQYRISSLQYQLQQLSQ